METFKCGCGKDTRGTADDEENFFAMCPDCVRERYPEKDVREVPDGERDDAPLAPPDDPNVPEPEAPEDKPIPPEERDVIREHTIRRIALWSSLTKEDRPLSTHEWTKADAETAEYVLDRLNEIWRSVRDLTERMEISEDKTEELEIHMEEALQGIHEVTRRNRALREDIGDLTHDLERHRRSGR